MADTDTLPADPAPPADEHPPLGGLLMNIVVVTICAVWAVSHLLQYLPYMVLLTAEQKAPLGTTIQATDNLMLIAAGYFLGGSQGGRALADRLSRKVP